MKMTILCDNCTRIDKYLYGEPAYSVYIENEDDKILLDVGYSDVYLKNAQLLNIDIKSVNKIVLSHGHSDHVGGMKFLPKNRNRTLYYSQHFLEDNWADGVNVFNPYPLEKVREKLEINYIGEPTEISPNLFLLGKIPRITNFEKFGEGMSGYEGDFVAESFLYDTALCYVIPDGIVVISACSHAGICNICEQAKKVFQKNIIAVIGGFHLLSMSSQAKATIMYFKKHRKIKLFPCHCTSLFVKAEMIKQKLDVSDVYSGLVLEF